MLLQILGIPFILCFLCKLYQLDINRRERIRKKELESSRFTRNQPKFNLLNCQDNFQDQNGFHQDQNGFQQDQNTTILNTEPINNKNIKQRKKKNNHLFIYLIEKNRKDRVQYF